MPTVEEDDEHARSRIARRLPAVLERPRIEHRPRRIGSAELDAFERLDRLAHAVFVQLDFVEPQVVDQLAPRLA